jgi:hypothetical protein
MAKNMRNYLLFVLLLTQGTAIAQAPTQLAIKANIDSYSSNYPQERIYIQFDKPAYAAGETVWFKAYLMKGFELSNLSKNFYIDFTDPDGNILMHGVYPIQQASAAGNFDISSYYTAKNIHVRAYTKWMLNFDSVLLYNRDLRILPKATPNAKTPTKPVLTASIQFFPEGGDCVAGVNTKVAFKANYQNGLPAAAKGVIVNSKGAVIDSIKTQHDGMGFFYLEAQTGETYTAKWADDQKATYQTPLPAAKPFGVGIEIKPAHGKTGFLIRRSDNAPAQLQELHIVATMHQQVVYMAGVKLDATTIIGGAVPTAQLPSGILQVTLFDANWLPVVERITFVNNNEFGFEPEVGFAALGTSRRGRNVLVIDVPDSIEANLSVSVTDAGLGVDSSDDIVSHMLVTGDLKGRVYHPSYYFSNNSDSVAGHLDLVMLTNGWRRFKWDEVIAGQAHAIKYPRDSSWLSFSGKVYGGSPQEIREAGSILIMASGLGKDSSKQFFTLPLKSDGSFSKPGFNFYDTLKVFYQFSSKGGGGMNNSSEVVFNNGGIPSPRHIFVDKNNLSYSFYDTSGNYRANLLAYERLRLDSLLKTTTLVNVTVTTKAKSPVEVLDEKYATGLFSGGDAAGQFDLIHDPTAAAQRDVFSFLTGRVAGLTITGSGGPQVSASWRGSAPDIYIDEVKADMNTVNSLNMSDIAYIKVMRPPFFGSSGGGAGGAIAIYTRRGGDEQSRPGGKGLSYKLVAGYTRLKEFYSPNYGTFDPKNDSGDVRSTIYWNPSILTTTENHILKFQFYNNDVTDSFRVILEGVSRDGKLTRVEKLIE